MPQNIDYEALAQQARSIDFDALAKQVQIQPAVTNQVPLAQRQQLSKSEFESNLPESTMATRAREAAIGVLEPFTASNMLGTLKTVGSGIKDALTGNAVGAVQKAGGMVQAAAEPMGNWVGGIASGDYDRAAYGAGGMLSQTAPAVAGAAEMTKPALVKGLRSAETGLNKSALKQHTKAMAPTGAELTAKTQEVAPRLAAEGDWALTGRRLDIQEVQKLKNAHAEWKAAADSVPASAEINTGDLLKTLDAQAEARQLRTPQGLVEADPTVNAIEDAYNAVSKMAESGRPNTVPFSQLRKYLGILDDRIQSMGGFRATGTEGARVARLQQAGNAIRDTLAKYDARLATANKALSDRLKLQQVIQTRDLAQEVSGINNSRKLPFIGNPFDDMAATGIGYAAASALGVPGIVGAAGLEGLNLARQSRGISSMRGVAAGKLASGVGGVADYLQPRYRGLLGEGMPLPNGGQAMSSMAEPYRPNVAPGTAAERTGRLLGETTGGPYAGQQGFPLEQTTYVPDENVNVLGVTDEIPANLSQGYPGNNSLFNRVRAKKGKK